MLPETIRKKKPQWFYEFSLHVCVRTCKRVCVGGVVHTLRFSFKDRIVTLYLALKGTVGTGE